MSLPCLPQGPAVAFLFLIRSMRALVAAVAILLIAGALPAEHQFLSPNGKFEAYTTPANEDVLG